MKGQAMNRAEEIMRGFSDLVDKWTWLNKIEMEESLKGHKSSEVHCIEFIGSNADSNVTKLAESSYMTRGAISKLTRKLIKKGYIESYQKPDNKKEVYFRLTGQGQALNRLHEKLHEEFQERDKAVFEQVTGEQFDAMFRLIENYSRHLDTEMKKLGVAIPNRDTEDRYYIVDKETKL